jgi:hypothetical protein
MPAIRTSKTLAVMAAISACATAIAWADPPPAAPAAPPAPPTRIAYPAPSEYSKIVFDREDEKKITGQVSQVDTADGGIYVWVLAKSVESAGFGSRPDNKSLVDSQVWRVEGTALKQLKAADAAKLVAGAEVIVQGLNSTDKTCLPTCRMKAESVLFK